MQEPSCLYQLGRLHQMFSVQLEEFRQRCSVWDTDDLRLSRKAYQENNIGLALELEDGEIMCAIIPHKGSGKCVPGVFKESKLDEITETGTTTLRFSTAVIGMIPYMVIWDSAISGANRLASKLVALEVTGPVRFIMLDHNYRPTHMALATFKKLAMS